MKYSSPEIPEGINYSKAHPLKEFFVLVAGVLGLFLAALLAFVLLSEAIAPHIPFSLEKKITSLQPVESEEGIKPVEIYLQQLADRLAEAQRLPADMAVTIHYINDDTVNAFATLGGHIMVFRGLLAAMPNENTLAMVLAHEIAHIKYRHPIMGLGRGIVLGVAMTIISRSIGNDIVTNFLGNTGLFTVLKFNREQEREADMTALMTLEQHYGHVQGADRVFEILQQQNGQADSRMPEFFTSHPLTDHRIDDIHSHAQSQGWLQTGASTRLPSSYKDWLTTAEGSL